MKVTMIPIGIGALGPVTNVLEERLEESEIRGKIETIQTTALLRLVRVLRRVLEIWRDLLSLKLTWKNSTSYWYEKHANNINNNNNKCLQRAYVPEWMTKGRTTLIQKDPNKWTTCNNYRPITCLPTAQIREEIYYSLTSCGLFPDEQKWYCKGSRGTAELLYTDQHILSENKTRRKNIAMAWINYKKAYDMVPHSWKKKQHQNVQNIIWRYKLYRHNHENLESGIACRRKRLSWSKDPKRYFPRRCSITLTIHNCHDPT